MPSENYICSRSATDLSRAGQNAVRRIKKPVGYFLFPALLCLPVLLLAAENPDAETGWKAGVARVIITPDAPMWIAGYGSRDHESEGKLHDVWAKALAFEDNKGQRAVLVTTDLLGFPKALSDRIRDQIQSKYGLSRAQIILNSSHTHTGPVVSNSLYNIYPLDSAQIVKIERYSKKLEKQIVTLVGQALKSLKPATLHAENGVTRFQVNRRHNTEKDLNLQTALKGPIDHSVPVIKVTDAKGKLIAVAFGYACHATVLATYKWSGDFPGFAQLELEKLYPGATALFFQGAGADQNPLPRRSDALAKQYGTALALAVDRVLNEPMRKLPPGLATAYAEVDLQMEAVPGAEELEKHTSAVSVYPQRWAIGLLAQLKKGGKLRTSYPYPVQVWQLGDQPIVALGGELVIDYALAAKKMLGAKTFVMGFSNDVMAYIPSATVWKEGGYEGDMSSQMEYGLPAKWTAHIETTIMQEVGRLATQAGINQNIEKQ